MVKGRGVCCIGLLPAFLATLGIAASLLSCIWCEAIQFNPDARELGANIDDGVLPTLKFGLYYYKKVDDLSASSINSQEEENWQDYFSYTQSCVQYGSGIGFDAAWSTARAFALIAPITGGFLALGLYMSPCCIFFSRKTWNMMALSLLLVVPAFQSLTLLILASDACKNNPILEGLSAALSDMVTSFGASTPSPESITITTTAPNGNATESSANDEDTKMTNSNSTTMIGAEAEAAVLSIYGETCEWDWGTYANIVSMCLFFVTGVVMILMGPPTRPPPKEPEVQTVTYEQKTDEEGKLTVEEVDVTTQTIQPGGPSWANPNHSNPVVPPSQMETAKPY